jgi:galactokinase
MLLDCRSLDFKMVPISDPDVVVFIANSNVTHKLSDSEYPKRKAACEQAVGVIQARFPEVKALRDATMKQLEECKSTMDPLTFRRARHVIGECVRFPHCLMLRGRLHSSILDSKLFLTPFICRRDARVPRLRFKKETTLGVAS